MEDHVLPKSGEHQADSSFVHLVNATLRQYQLESLVVFAGSSICGFGGFFAAAWLSGIDLTSLAVGSLLHLVTRRPRMACSLSASALPATTAAAPRAPQSSAWHLPLKTAECKSAGSVHCQVAAIGTAPILARVAPVLSKFQVSALMGLMPKEHVQRLAQVAHAASIGTAHRSMRR
jgi:hypothetical protein